LVALVRLGGVGQGQGGDEGVDVVLDVGFEDAGGDLYILSGVVVKYRDAVGP